MNFNDYDEYIKFLQQNRNQKTSLFNKKLISTKFEILGLKIPFMRKFSKEIVKNGLQELILSRKDFVYYEQILIYGFVLASIKIDENKRIEKIDSFLNCFDNWSVVDSFCASLKTVKKNKKLYFDFASLCVKNDNDFKKRFGIVLLMDYFLNENNLSQILKLVLSTSKNGYYVVMSVAWFFATSFAKNFDETKNFLLQNKNYLSPQLKQKIISKCQDSFRISQENKKLIKEFLGGE
ncbi:MAG: DNA alkylation repair protein [Christensenellales bacterium]